jgi:hypothetical protein
MIKRYHLRRGVAIAGSEKRGRGRPKTGIGPNIGLRLYPELEAALDAWITEQPEPKPSRPEAIRRILKTAFDLGHSEDAGGAV